MSTEKTENEMAAVEAYRKGKDFLRIYNITGINKNMLSGMVTASDKIKRREAIKSRKYKASEALKEWDEIHDWYVQYKEMHPEQLLP